MLRAVIDTNVLLQGLTRHGTAGRIIDAWHAGAFKPAVSTTLALEYEEVLLRRFPAAKHDIILGALQALLDRADYVPIFFRVRPASPDPDDDFVLECAFNAGALLVSENRKDLADPALHLGVEWVLPRDFLSRIDSQE